MTERCLFGEPGDVVDALSGAAVELPHRDDVPAVGTEEARNDLPAEASVDEESRLRHRFSGGAARVDHVADFARVQVVVISDLVERLSGGDTVLDIDDSNPGLYE